jgi:hypothetical protein
VIAHTFGEFCWLALTAFVAGFFFTVGGKVAGRILG